MAGSGVTDPDSGRTTTNLVYTLDHVNIFDDGFARMVNAYQGPHDTWALDDGANDPETTFVSDTASDSVNPTLSGDPTVGGTPADLEGNALWVTADHFGTAVSPGTTGGVQTEGPPVDTSRSYTYTLWAKLADTTKDQTVFSQDTGTGRGVRLWYNHTGNEWNLQINDHESSLPGSFMTEPADRSLNQWTGFVIEYNANVDAFDFAILWYDNVDWVNGCDDPLADVCAMPEREPATTASLSIGYDDKGNQFNGPIANVQAWSYVLSDAQKWSLRNTFFN